MDMAAIRAGLETNLRTISGLNASAYMTSEYPTPFAEVIPDELNYHGSMGDGVTPLRMVVRAYVGSMGDVDVQKKLDGYLAESGASSVKAAIESDKRLGGACQTLVVVKCSGYRPYQIAERTVVLGAEWQVDIYA
jgi:hypothetical protein